MYRNRRHVVDAKAPIEARIGVTVVEIEIAILSFPALEAGAFIPADKVRAGPVDTWALSALILVLIAEETGPAWLAFAGKGPWAIDAGPVHAEILGTIVAILFAIRALKSDGTAAGVAIDAVDADAVIEA